MVKDGGKTPRKLTVDFSDTDIRRGGAGGIRVDEGDYLLEVRDAKVIKKKDSDSRYIAWSLYIVKPDASKGKGPIVHRTTLIKESLWSLRTFLADLMGEENVPKSSVDVPLAKIIEKRMKIGATVADDEPYNGKIKSKIAATFPKSEYDETAAPTKKKAADDDEDEEDEDEEDEDEEDEEEEKPKKKSKKAKAKSSKKSKKDDDDDEDEDDDEDLDELDTDDI